MGKVQVMLEIRSGTPKPRGQGSWYAQLNAEPRDLQSPRQHAEVWWGNTLQYFVIVWVATALLWKQDLTYKGYRNFAACKQAGCTKSSLQGCEAVRLR